MKSAIHHYDSRKNETALMDTPQLLWRDKPSRLFLRNLIRISLLSQYRRSFLGYSWLILQPLFGAITWLILDSAKIISPGASEIPYPIYVIFMSTLWAYFFGIYHSVSRTFEERGEFILQTCAKSDILIIERIVIHCINLVLPLILNFIILWSFGIGVHWRAIFLPLTLLPILLFATSIGLIINILRTLFFDFVKIFDVIFPLILFITPVVFVEKTNNPLFTSIVNHNPLTYLLCSARDLVLKGEVYGGVIYYWISAATFLLFILAYKTHKFSEKAVYERIVK